jgi:hypothetical protein
MIDAEMRCDMAESATQLVRAAEDALSGGMAGHSAPDIQRNLDMAQRLIDCIGCSSMQSLSGRIAHIRDALSGNVGTPALDTGDTQNDHT